MTYFYWSTLLLCASACLPTTAQTLPAHGLAATYYNGENFEEAVVERIDAQLDFEWHSRPPATGISKEHFSVCWTGFLEAPATGLYILHLTVDDGVRVWIGNRLLLESWRNQYVTDGQVRVRLEAGKVYALRVEYYQNALESRLVLGWERPDVSMEDFFSGRPIFEPIPTRYLWTALPVPPSEVREAGTPVPPAALAARPLPVAKPAALGSGGPGWIVPKAPARAVVPPDTLPVRLDGLAQLTKGQRLTLPNLYFTQSTADLLPSSRPTLNALARRLREQPAMRLEIAGHTDNVGEAALNLRLSRQRARVVRQYLVQQGIDSVRLAARGYGGTRPVADNRDPQQRPRNRRVEVVRQ
ncbi:OmpA family protein [Hymenobacter swuensis]|uniref:OmpA family protein n=1 Tax=Hymenobacter swuensis DY53 TaxID=1227739 RepID=W8F6H6_9BACT|nr:PA14 domain-containing protein [Hymenobacter swuensis]AHJ99632.1 hypothetical protein Hsw_4037 [Hymenobacter swuensis DY53]